MPDLNGQQFGEDDYRMRHRPPSPDDDYHAPMHDLTGSGMFPHDVYKRPDWYTGHDEPEMRRQINTARGNPEAPVRMYRAQPKEHRDIRPGDWVAPSLSYAKQHAQSTYDASTMHVVSAVVPAKHLLSEGNDLQEWGYAGHEPVRGRVDWRSRAKPREY